jgi:hypothetical protein
MERGETLLLSRAARDTRGVSTREQLVQRVRELADGSPYVVEDTAEGFDVRVDLANPDWRTAMSRKSVSRVFTHHVRVDEAKQSVSITDDLSSVSRETGVVRLARFQGRMIEHSRHKVVAWGRPAGAGEAVDYRFSSTEGHALIRTATHELGFEEHQGTAARIGLVFGIIGAVGAVVTVVALLVAWLSGVQFS